MKKFNLSKNIYVILMVIIAFISWVCYTNLNISKTEINIKNEKIPMDFSGFKIVQVSDLHNHNWGDKLTSKIENETPDIIVITGDLVDSSHTNIDVAIDFVKAANKIAPVYYVTGNHEAWLEDYDELENRLVDAGVHIMDDKSELIEKGDSKINIVGIQDPDFVERDTFDGIQESIVMKKLEPLLNDNFYNIVLCHRPELFNAYTEMKVDLAITGHAHGGQFRIPFIGGVIAPNQGFFPKYTEGVYHQDSTDMVVSRGLGNSILPVRINNMPELVVITLN